MGVIYEKTLSGIDLDFCHTTEKQEIPKSLQSSLRG